MVTQIHSSFQNFLYLFLLTPFVLFILFSFIFKIFSLQKIFSKHSLGAISAGLLISLTFIDFLPHSLENNTPAAFSITILITLVALLYIETHLIPHLNFFNRFLPEQKREDFMDCSHYHQYHHHPFSHQSSFSAIGCLLVCSFFDGLRLGSALLIDMSVTGVTAMATIFHIIPEAIAVISLAKNSGLTSRKCLLLQFVFCLFPSFGILTVGFFQLKIPFNIILSLSSATLLYVSFIHLLPIAFVKKNQIWFISSLILSSCWLILFH